MRISIPLLMLLALLSACNRDDQQAKLFEQQRNALDKAKAVDSTVQKQAQELQQNVNKQSGDAASQ
ncbi:MAG TPA: hypothetical protein VFR06_09055 [Gallionellaceae bacterium]|nr:hypothetical protein [Gallionellaceae bacterium]